MSWLQGSLGSLLRWECPSGGALSPGVAEFCEKVSIGYLFCWDFPPVGGNIGIFNNANFQFLGFGPAGPGLDRVVVQLKALIYMAQMPFGPMDQYIYINRVYNKGI